MLQYLVGFTIALCVILSISAASVNLTQTTLNQQLGQHKLMIVMYYAPWCSHSKETLPIWEQMSEMMAQNSQDKDIFVGKVDCVAEPDVYWQEGIQSFPTIKAYVNHNTIPIVYDGERVANTMWRYFRLLARQYVEEIATLDQFSDLQESKLSRAKPLVLAMLEPTDSLSDENDRNKKIDGACKKADRTSCFISRNPVLAQELNIPVPSVTMFTKFEAIPGEQDTFDIPVTNNNVDAMSALELATWLQDRAYPPLVELTAQNSELIFSPQRNGFQNHFLFLLHGGVNSNNGIEKLQKIREIGSKFAGKAVFIYIDMEELTEYSTEVLQSLEVQIPSPNSEMSATDTDTAKGVPIVNVTPAVRDFVHAVISKDKALRFYSGVEWERELKDVDAVERWVGEVLSGMVDPTRTSTFD